MEIRQCDFVLSTLPQPIICIWKEKGCTTNKINISRVAVIYLVCSTTFFFSDAKYWLRQCRPNKITQSNFHFQQSVWESIYYLYYTWVFLRKVALLREADLVSRTKSNNVPEEGGTPPESSTGFMNTEKQCPWCWKIMQAFFISIKDIHF